MSETIINNDIYTGSLNGYCVNKVVIDSLAIYSLNVNLYTTIAVTGGTINSLQSELVEYYYWDFGEPGQPNNIQVVKESIAEEHYYEYQNLGLNRCISLVEVRKDGVIIENNLVVNI